MIKNIIFDFGDVFINLDKKATDKALEKLLPKGKPFPDYLKATAINYEMGKISTDTFIRRFSDYFYAINDKEFVDIWNAVLLDFPQHRLAFLKYLNQTKKYRLLLLSNTNELHISWIKENWGIELYQDFKSQFEQFYLSHEIKMRKPNAHIYQFVLKENNLIASETLFIDDTKINTDAASKLGVQVWNINPEKEDVASLFNLKSHLF